MITNNKNNKVYIGQTWNAIEHRFDQHKRSHILQEQKRTYLYKPSSRLSDDRYHCFHRSTTKRSPIMLKIDLEPELQLELVKTEEKENKLEKVTKIYHIMVEKCDLILKKLEEKTKKVG